MTRGWLLPGSPSFLQIPGVAWGPLRGAPDMWAPGSPAGLGPKPLLGSCPRERRDSRASRLCVESWPHFRALITPLPVSVGQGLRGVCLGIKGRFGRNVEVEREGGAAQLRPPAWPERISEGAQGLGETVWGVTGKGELGLLIPSGAEEPDPRAFLKKS